MSVADVLPATEFDFVATKLIVPGTVSDFLRGAVLWSVFVA